MPHRDPRHARDSASHRQLATHRVEQGRATLARAGDARLLANARHEIRRDERHREHHPKRHEILRVRYRETVSGRHEVEVEHRDVRQRSGHRGPATKPQTYDDDAEQVHHRDVHELEVCRSAEIAISVQMAVIANAQT